MASGKGQRPKLLALLFVTVVINYMDRTNIAVAASAMSEDLQLSKEALGYIFGAWAIAWLCHRAGPDVLIERFYPAVEALGWEAAFGEAFGLTPAAFYAEFDRFLELDRARQLAILAADR